MAWDLSTGTRPDGATRRIRRWLGGITIALVAGGLGFLVGHWSTHSATPSMGATHPSGWIARFSTQVWFLHWVESRPPGSGSIAIAGNIQIDDNVSSTDNEGVSGTISGTTVAIATQGIANGTMVFGTLSSGRLTLSVPDSNGTLHSVLFTPGNSSDFNAAVDGIRSGSMAQP